MSENQTVEGYPRQRCQIFIGEIGASLTVNDCFRCGRTVAHGVLGGCMQPTAAPKTLMTVWQRLLPVVSTIRTPGIGQ